MHVQVKRELRLLRLRGAMDPKRFYKSFDQSKFPKYFQFGTVVEGPADFYAGALAHGLPNHNSVFPGALTMRRWTCACTRRYPQNAARTICHAAHACGGPAC